MFRFATSAATARFRWLVGSTMPLAIAVLLWSGCSSDSPSPTDGGGTGGGGDYDSLLDDAGSLFDLEFVSDDVIDTDPTPVGESEDSDETRGDGSRWRCSRQTVKDENADENYFTFNPNSEVIWPGNLLQGSTLTRATPAQIVVDRGSMDVSVNLLNGSDEIGVSATVDNVNISNMADAINTILQNNTGIIPANFTYNASSVSSQEEMAAKLGVSFNTLTSDFKSQMSFESDVSLSRVLVTFQQQMYTMVVTPPTSVQAFFADNVGPSDLEPFVGPANPPAYISSVTYGRRFFALIESRASRQELEVSVRASYDGAVTDGSLKGDVDYVTDLEGTTIKVFSLGGSASQIPEAITGTDLSELNRLLTDQDGTLFYTAVPLSYVVRDIRTHQIVYVKSANSYDIVECSPLDVSADDVLFQFVAEDLIDDAVNTKIPQQASPPNILGYDNGSLEVWIGGTDDLIGGAPVVERWVGRRNATASYVQSGERPVLIKGDTPTGKASVGLLAVDLPVIGGDGVIAHDAPPIETEMAFSAAGLENSDYTIFAVVRMDRLINIRQRVFTIGLEYEYKNVEFLNYPNGPFYGVGTAVGENLQFGVRSALLEAPRIYAEHSHVWPVNGLFEGKTGTGEGYIGGLVDRDVYQVLAVVYRQPVGEDAGTLQLWKNGTMVVETTPPVAVTSLSGARLGASYNSLYKVLGAFFRIAEFRGYDIALNEDQVGSVVSNLRAEYGI